MKLVSNSDSLIFGDGIRDEFQFFQVIHYRILFICSCFNLLLDMIFDMIYGIYIYIVNLIYVMDLLVEKKALISCYYFILLIIWLCPIIAAIGGSDKECVVPEHKGHKCF